VKVEQVMWNVLNTLVMTMNCVSKTEFHRELIQGLQNLGKDRETDRQIDIKTL
jgi:hypothetical protein